MQDKQDKPTTQIQKTNLLLDFFPRRAEITKKRMLCIRLIASTPTDPRFTLPCEPGAECDCACK